MIRLGLGTVQFGIDYGVTNQSGQVPEMVVHEILDAAHAAKLGLLDTAALYGNSETVLGHYGADRFSVVSKTPRFSDSSSKANAKILKQCARESLQKLKTPKLHGLLAHHAPNLLDMNGPILWDAMRELRDQGLTGKIGASVYFGSDIDALLDRYDDVDLVQLPMNILDQRLIAGGQIARLVERGVEIHVRSVFLQGLLLAARTPPHLTGLQPWLERWRAAALVAGLSPMTAAFAFIKSVKGLDAAIVGVTSVGEFKEVRAAFQCPVTFDADNLACNETDLIDPSRWGRS